MTDRYPPLNIFYDGDQPNRYKIVTDAKPPLQTITKENEKKSIVADTTATKIHERKTQETKATVTVGDRY